MTRHKYPGIKNAKKLKALLSLYLVAKGLCSKNQMFLQPAILVSIVMQPAGPWHFLAARRAGCAKFCTPCRAGRKLALGGTLKIPMHCCWDGLRWNKKFYFMMHDRTKVNLHTCFVKKWLWKFDNITKGYQTDWFIWNSVHNLCLKYLTDYTIS